MRQAKCFVSALRDKGLLAFTSEQQTEVRSVLFFHNLSCDLLTATFPYFDFCRVSFHPFYILIPEVTPRIATSGKVQSLWFMGFSSETSVINLIGWEYKMVTLHMLRKLDRPRGRESWC